MARWDDYLDIDPEEFEAGGGLYGRLASMLPQQSFYQPTDGAPFPQVSGNANPSPSGNSPAAVPQVPPIAPVVPQSVSSWPRDNGQTLNMRIGDYWMPQFGRAEPPLPAVAPTFGDRLNAGFQSWAHTPLGNPFAALANGIAGFNSGQSSVAPNNGPVAGTSRDIREPAQGIAPRPRSFTMPLRKRGLYNGR